jgi:hypothetical protein
MNESKSVIEAELRRVVGGPGVDCELVETDEGGPVACVTTAHGCYELPPQSLAELLRDMPDGAGVLALRAKLEQRPDAAFRASRPT